VGFAIARFDYRGYMGLWIIILGFERVHGECFITEDTEGYRRPEA